MSNLAPIAVAPYPPISPANVPIAPSTWYTWDVVNGFSAAAITEFFYWSSRVRIRAHVVFPACKNSIVGVRCYFQSFTNRDGDSSGTTYFTLANPLPYPTGIDEWRLSGPATKIGSDWWSETARSIEVDELFNLPWPTGMSRVSGLTHEELTLSGAQCAITLIYPIRTANPNNWIRKSTTTYLPRVARTKVTVTDSTAVAAIYWVENQRYYVKGFEQKYVGHWDDADWYKWELTGYYDPIVHDYTESTTLARSVGIKVTLDAGYYDAHGTRTFNYDWFGQATSWASTSTGYVAAEGSHGNTVPGSFTFELGGWPNWSANSLHVTFLPPA